MSDDAAEMDKMLEA